VHLVGFIIIIYHDTRSPERQKLTEEFVPILLHATSLTVLMPEDSLSPDTRHMNACYGEIHYASLV